MGLLRIIVLSCSFTSADVVCLLLLCFVKQKMRTIAERVQRS